MPRGEITKKKQGILSAPFPKIKAKFVSLIFNQRRMLKHKYYIEDLSVREVTAYVPPGGVEIYEVVRVMDGVPLFLEDHLDRFYHSAWLCHLGIPMDKETIVGLLRKLTAVNGVTEGNIRFSWSWRPAGKFLAGFIPHHYPGEEEYRLGVVCGLLDAERHDPNAKVVQEGLREAADRMIRDLGVYEVLLVNRDGNITEGSRSNVFFIKEGILLTAPSDEVLPGITRQKVLELISREGLRVETRSMALEELPHAEAAFLTGTSPKLLPIRKVNEFLFPSEHPLVKRLAEAYDTMISDIINKNR